MSQEFKVWDFINEDTLVIKNDLRGNDLSYLHYFRGYYLQASDSPEGVGCVHNDSQYAWHTIKNLLGDLRWSYDRLTSQSKNITANLIIYQILSVIEYCSHEDYDFIVDKIKTNKDCKEVVNLLKLVGNIMEDNGLDFKQEDFTHLITVESFDSENVPESLVESFSPCVDEKEHIPSLSGRYNKDTFRLSDRKDPDSVMCQCPAFYMACGANTECAGIFFEINKFKLDDSGKVTVIQNEFNHKVEAEPVDDKSKFYDLTKLVNEYTEEIYRREYDTDCIILVDNDQENSVLALFNMCIQQIRFDLNLKYDFTNNYDNIVRVTREVAERKEAKERSEKFKKTNLF